MLCPHCERDLTSHDNKPCPRKFTRRFFFGLMAGAVATAAVPPDKIAMSVMVDEWNTPGRRWIRSADSPLTITVPRPEFFVPGDKFLINSTPEVFTVVSVSPFKAIRGNLPNRQTVNLRT